MRPVNRRYTMSLLAGLLATSLVLGGCQSAPPTASTPGVSVSVVPSATASGSASASPTPSGSAEAAGVIPPEFAKLPRLEGEATVVITVGGQPITIKVDGKNAPISGGNFVDLVQKGVYNGTVFHRVVRNPQPFVVQGGDPTSKDPNVDPRTYGTGSYVDEATKLPRFIPLEIKTSGTTTYGKTLEEAQVTDKPVLKHSRGAVAMARSQDPNSASAQFYFTLGDVNFLDGNYAVFGTVSEGMDVVDKIEANAVIDSAEVTAGAENLKVAK
jgi:peptidyl-prolyl cis-trans isomerase B (cyclophilin B)